MEVYERIKILRKKFLKLTQEDFGYRLGVSRDTIGNIELNRLARPDQKLSLIKLICKEFSVNEDWLLNGNEPMFVEPDAFSLDEFVKQRGATDRELQIVKTYFDLDADTRKMLVDHFIKGLTLSAPADETERERTIAELEEEYKKSVLNSASVEGSAASSSIEDTEKTG